MVKYGYISEEEKENIIDSHDVENIVDNVENVQ